MVIGCVSVLLWHNQLSVGETSEWGEKEVSEAMSGCGALGVLL